MRDCSGFETLQWLIERSWSCRHSVYICVTGPCKFLTWQAVIGCFGHSLAGNMEPVGTLIATDHLSVLTTAISQVPQENLVGPGFASTSSIRSNAVSIGWKTWCFFAVLAKNWIILWFVFECTGFPRHGCVILEPTVGPKM